MYECLRGLRAGGASGTKQYHIKARMNNDKKPRECEIKKMVSLLLKQVAYTVMQHGKVTLPIHPTLGQD